MITFDREPGSYQHWRLTFDGPVATLTLDVDEDGGIDEGYKLKLNSYDLGVDIELRDALDRIRFEHPEVGAVVLASGKERMFCAGANIYMLGKATHATKVNFCKFTNETRNGIEDSSEQSGLKFLAAVNGTAAGGGYELALACDEIVLVDDRSSTVSFPEVPLLAVLPGTGGLTRLVDKRRIRRDLADVFCTTAEGFGGKKAKDWGLVDDVVPARVFTDKVKERALALAAQTDRPKDAKGITLTPLRRSIDETGLHYEHVDVAIDAEARTITITVAAPSSGEPEEIDANALDGIMERGAQWWPLAMARELDDAILHLRTNVREAGIWIVKTRGDLNAMLRIDHALHRHHEHWFVRETIGFIRRTFARLDVSSRSIYAVIDPGSCFAGTLFELALAADRSYMLATEENAPRIALSPMNFGPYAMVNDLTRLETRFGREVAFPQDTLLDAEEAIDAGLVTFAPDELDWDDELRLAIEERASLSPDALTGMEASLRFGGRETIATKIFGRLSAWQNWIFIRPNAVGEQGALKLFGSGTKPKFTWERI
ncbi:MAG TPA: 2,3-epoxybenzoyl-CoA dihydrolase [Thermoanaerobaculia bacterium]|jgi:benzoyl-CoA-dihydrodiol lyase|nr:2,3-epoxybenzoyl-CoA dihydrolase [Thermoanaerobaculia bacterium]